MTQNHDTALYLDHNATTPPHPDVLAAMQQAAAQAWANPASVHRHGQRARAELDRCRAAVAQLFGTSARDVYLTSGGTEANNLALWHAFAPCFDEPGDDHDPGVLVLSRIEHPSVLQPALALARRGVELRWLEPSESGRVAPEDMEALMDARVRLVTVMAVNHETGVIQPTAELAAVAAAHGVPFHTDAVQAVGKVRCDWRADLITVAAHKIRGPKGIGALVTQPRVKLRPILVGGEQERGARPGTVSAELAAGFRVAAERARSGAERHRALAPLRDALREALVELGGVVNGVGPLAPHVLNVSFLGRRGPELVAALDLEGIAVSSGSACSAGTAAPSPVVTAMVGRERAGSAVRLSLGDGFAPEDVPRVVAAFSRVLDR